MWCIEVKPPVHPYFWYTVEYTALFNPSYEIEGYSLKYTLGNQLIDRNKGNSNERQSVHHSRMKGPNEGSNRLIVLSIQSLLKFLESLLKIFWKPFQHFKNFSPILCTIVSKCFLTSSHFSESFANYR